MSAFLDFTRGGQVQFHGIHMFCQVALKFIKIGFYFFLILTALLFIYKTKPYERYLLGQWAKASLCQGNLLCPKTLTHINTKGMLHNYSAKQILSTPDIKKQIRLSKHCFLSTVKISWAISTVAAFIIAILLAHLGKLKNQQQHSRGAQLAAPKEFKRIIKNAHMASKWTLGGVPLPKEADTQHILLCGSPGGGKSVCTHELLTQVRKADQRALVYDVKGAFIPHYYRPGKDIILNPIDERSPSWNLWSECLSLTDFDAMAAAIVPDSSGSESFWNKAARTLLSISAAQFKHRPNPRMSDLIYHLFCSDLKEVEKLLLGTLGNAMVGKDLEKGTRSVILTLVTYCKYLMYLKD